jgi:hypothetical protein
MDRPTKLVAKLRSGGHIARVWYRDRFGLAAGALLLMACASALPKAQPPTPPDPPVVPLVLRYKQSFPSGDIHLQRVQAFIDGKRVAAMKALAEPGLRDIAVKLTYKAAGVKPLELNRRFVALLAKPEQIMVDVVAVEKAPSGELNGRLDVQVKLESVKLSWREKLQRRDPTKEPSVQPTSSRMPEIAPSLVVPGLQMKNLIVICVGPDGRVQSQTLLVPCDDEFDGALLDAISDWKYPSGLRSNDPEGMCTVQKNVLNVDPEAPSSGSLLQ